MDMSEAVLRNWRRDARMGLLRYFCTRYSGDDNVKNTASRTRFWRAVAWLVVGIAIELTASRIIVLVAALMEPAVRNSLSGRSGGPPCPPTPAPPGNPG